MSRQQNKRTIGSSKSCVDLIFHPPPKKKVPFEVLIRNSTSANSIAVEKFRNLCYNNKQAGQVCQNA